MEKSKAGMIIDTAFNSLKQTLNTQNEYNPHQLIDHLNQLAKDLASSSTTPLSFYSNDNNLELEFKNLAKESLESYAQTQESVDKINQEHHELIQKSFQEESAKVNNLLNNFSNIHTMVADQMRQANETIKSLQVQISELENISNLDPLTRTYNRRALDAYITSLCKEKKRVYDTRILLIDIDDFKDVNDSYGHLAGDRVLMYLGKLINTSLRDGDKVFRFGGEEFLVIINRANKEACELIAERLLNTVRSSSLMYQNNKIKITLSIGSAVFQQGDDFESFIERADKALYTAKNKGKDQLVVG